jgi:thiamine pyrophosphate-dependent acetolactate synthase large subunit-like protein
VKVDIPIVGDVKDVLAELIAHDPRIRPSSPMRRAGRLVGTRSTAGASATA